MKFIRLTSYAHVVAWVNSMPKITSLHPAKNKNSLSINTAVNSDTSPNYSTNVNYLKPFDTAFIAYYMMGFGNLK